MKAHKLLADKWKIILHCRQFFFLFISVPHSAIQKNPQIKSYWYWKRQKLWIKPFLIITFQCFEFSYHLSDSVSGILNYFILGPSLFVKADKKTTSKPKPWNYKRKGTYEQLNNLAFHQKTIDFSYFSTMTVYKVSLSIHITCVGIVVPNRI